MGGKLTLCVILGDQLSPTSPLLDDPGSDRHFWMAEVPSESTHIPSSKMRTAIFLSSMRHYGEDLRKRGLPLHYRRLDDPTNQGSLEAELQLSIAELKPGRAVVVQPGEHRVLTLLRDVCGAAGIPLEVLPDPHFYTTPAEFQQHARGRKQLRLEYFYRELRRRHSVLMENGEPAGGAWNFDAENREAFARSGPGSLPAPMRFPPDTITQEVMGLVKQQFSAHPGDCEDFDWPVTPQQARQALDDFITHRLPLFGRYQDAIWTGQPWLYHSRISSSLNLHLLDPRIAVQEAERAYQQGHAPLAAVEGFIRQILGWREYVRGIYWMFMPDYAGMNALDARGELPGFYWTGETEMACLRDAIGQTLKYGYAHHIQRLMVTGLYALLAGVEPRQVHEWYLSVYVDAVEWVELPNTIGMSQFADGGLMASKPYAATGKYIQRMSNACRACRFDPAESTGERACPFTTLYWDFLIRNEPKLKKVPRMELQLKNLARLSPQQRRAIAEQAETWKG